MDVSALLRLFLDEGPRWVESVRSAHRSLGRSLSTSERSQLEPFFGGRTIHEARVVPVPAIPNPPFYASVPPHAWSSLLDFSQMAGTTFRDTILISTSRTSPEPGRLLFHEMVHVTQFDVLGVKDFVHHYVVGWAANGFRYDAIPLEVQAYALEDRFASNSGTPFSVHREVVREFAVGS